VSRADLPEDWEGQVTRAYAVFDPDPAAEAEFWAEVGWNPDDDFPEDVVVEPPKKMLERVAGELHHGALAREPAITEAIGNAVGGAGGVLVGIENRVKELPAIKRKLERMLRSGVDLDEAVGMVPDAVRYTVVLPDDRYMEGSAAVLDGLGGEHVVVEKQNGWSGGPDEAQIWLRGERIWLRGGGGLWEAQIHTPASVAARDGSAKDYRLLRRGGGTVGARDAAWQRVATRWGNVSRPVGADSLWP
jgi:hypothetical protein